MKLRNRLRHLRPAAALLLTAALLCGQTVAAAHLHADELADASCAVCNLAKAATAASDSHAPVPDVPVVSAHPVTAATDVHPPAAACPFQPRGPPRA